MANNNKKRSTRRAFGRRALAFGIAMFAMVTLTAVGFAAWLISTNATAEAEGGIVTQTVSQANIKIEVTNVNGGKLYDWVNATEETKPEYEIVFAPEAGTTGLITFDGKNGADKPENLKFSFQGNIQNWDRVGTLNFSVRVPDSVVAAAGLTKSGNTWTYTAANAYVKLPDYAMAADGSKLPKVTSSTWTDNGEESWTAPISFTNLSDNNATLEVDFDGNEETAGGIVIGAPSTGTTATFTGTDLAFGWGARYGGYNPATTFNGADWTNVANTGVEKDKTYTTNQIQLELIKLQTIVNGITLDNYYDSVKVDNVTLKTAIGGSNIDAYVKTADATTVQKYLAELQTAVANAISTKGRPQYKLFIEAIVRS